MEETDKVVAGGGTEALLAKFYIRESVSWRSTSYILRITFIFVKCDCSSACSISWTKFSMFNIMNTLWPSDNIGNIDLGQH